MIKLTWKPVKAAYVKIIQLFYQFLKRYQLSFHLQLGTKNHHCIQFCIHFPRNLLPRPNLDR